MTNLPGYYELDPEDNHFTDVTADVTHQCNMTCQNCYIPNRDIPDMDICLLYTSPSPRDRQKSRMPSSA